MSENLFNPFNLFTFFNDLNRVNKLNRFFNKWREIPWLANTRNPIMIAFEDTPQQQRLFPMEYALAHPKAKAVGNAGERLALALLQRSGYKVVTPRQGEQRGDLIAIDRRTGVMWNIEVKTARRGKAGMYQFCLARHLDGRTCTDWEHSHYVILIAALPTGAGVPFVIPTVDIPHGMKHLNFRAHPLKYAGKWARYRQTGPTIQLGA